jgi:hypothetical protein
MWVEVICGLQELVESMIWSFNAVQLEGGMRAIFVMVLAII